MNKEAWLPTNFILENGEKIQSLLYSGDCWQIYQTTEKNYLLITFLELIEKWDQSQLLSNLLFSPITYQDKIFYSLLTPNHYALFPVNRGKSPDNKIDGLSFALALKESRKISPNVSFHDAIYLEQYARLLPTWTETPAEEDQIILGSWLSGGVKLSTNDFHRLSHLTPRLSPQELADIIQAAGFTIPDHGQYLIKNKSQSFENKQNNQLTSFTDQDSSSPEKIVKKFHLPGREKLESFFNEYIIDIIFNIERYQSFGIDFPSAVILHGPPGCGKTYAVEKLVEFIDWPSYNIDSTTIASPYIHDTSKKISEVFQQAINNAPAIIIIDEMESFLSNRNAENSSGLHHIEEVAEFLRQIPIAIKQQVLIIAMTNLINMIDPAILRRGRFDHIIEVEMPTREEVSSLIQTLLKNLPQEENLSLENILYHLTGKPLSDTAFLIREAARLTAKMGKDKIDQKSLDLALKTISERSY